MIHVMHVLEATVGGTRRYLEELVEALSPDEFRLTLICSVQRDASFRTVLDRWRARSIETVELHMVRAPHPHWDPLCVLALRRLIASRRPDVLHLHSAKAGWLGRLAIRGLPCGSVVYTPHGFPFLQRHGPLVWLYAVAERWLAPRTTVLLAVGTAEGRLAIESGLYAPDRVHVIRNATDTSRRLPHRSRSPGELPVLGFLGELRRQKDPQTFLQALAILRARAVSVRALLPMRGTLLKRTRRSLARLGLGREVVGFVPADSSLNAILSETDVAVLPSLWEGLPYSMLDAMARGIPVVGSDIPPIADVLGQVDPVLLFRAGSPASLANSIQAVLHYPNERRTLIERRSQEVVRREHDARRWAEEMRAFYRALAASRSHDATPAGPPGPTVDPTQTPQLGLGLEPERARIEREP